jgi:hypothetical protein
MRKAFAIRETKVLLLLAGIAMISGCAAFRGESKPAVVPEISPGILPGYLKPETLPGNLALPPPPPAAGAAEADMLSPPKDPRL